MNLRKFHNLNFFPSTLLPQTATTNCATKMTRTTQGMVTTGTATMRAHTTTTTSRKVGPNDMTRRSGLSMFYSFFSANIHLYIIVIYADATVCRDGGRKVGLNDVTCHSGPLRYVLLYIYFLLTNILV